MTRTAQSASRQGKPAWSLGVLLKPTGRALFHVAVLSGFVNILMLTSPIYMMQVYDRVLASQRIPTLVALSLIALFAYMVFWLLDLLRQRIVAYLGERVEAATMPIVQVASIEVQLRNQGAPVESLQLFRDMESLRTFVGGPGPIALFDLPWIPLYLGLIFVLHPLLGWITVAGALILVLLTLLTEVFSTEPTTDAMNNLSRRNMIAENAQRGAEVLHAHGMAGNLWAKWDTAHNDYVVAQRKGLSRTAALSGLAKTMRYILQSAVLGLGAYLVIRNEMSGGAIIAASILSGRALAPIDQAIASWRPFIAARKSYARLQRILPGFAIEGDRMQLPPPKSGIEAIQVDVAIPGTNRLIVRGITFALEAGDGLGIIGPSASGKTSLARVLIGVWTPAKGRVLLDKASIDQFERSMLGKHIGFMPQDVQLFDGTIAENIARFSADANPDAIIEAARAANFHDQILAFPEGYDTRVGLAGSHLSAGQRQRLGLARALFGRPFLVVLDEPNANLDVAGEQSVSQAIAAVRAWGGIAIVIAHRPSAISHVNKLLVIQNGEMRAFGPRDEVLAKTTVAPPARGEAPARGDEVVPERRITPRIV